MHFIRVFAKNMGDSYYELGAGFLAFEYSLEFMLQY